MSAPGHAPPITEVETHGIETIPPEDRTASPFDLFRVAFGGANTFATVVLGAFPILIFGLSFWQGFLATVAGIVIGGLILMPMALFGPVTGTNNAVSSGAHFGVVGRIVGSFLSLLTAITFFAISVYTSGDILVGALDELAGTGQPDWLLAVAYGFFAVVVLVICLYGFQFMLAVNKVAVVTATLLYLVGAIAYAPDFDAGYAGTVGTRRGGARAGVHRRHAAGDGQPALVRRVPGRLGALHPGERPAQAADAGRVLLAGRDDHPVHVRPGDGVDHRRAGARRGGGRELRRRARARSRPAGSCCRCA